jgi:protein gp37
MSSNTHSKMFPFITATWNPLGGECLHNCSYCWAKKLARNYKMQKYVGEARLFPLELVKVFKHTDFVFTCDMTDLFGGWVPKEIIQRILDRMLTSQATYLLLTKNPARYLEFDLPKNCVAGATIESDYTSTISTRPITMSRIKAMQKLKHPRKMVSVEPIMHHSESFAYMIRDIQPEFVAVGYDNYNNNLVEPFLGDTIAFIDLLEEWGIKVYRKTLREKA